MQPRFNSDFGYVVTMLANRLRPETWNGGKILPLEARKDRQVVFLLGAGCSRQYGLPTFYELLTYFWQDCYHSRPDSSWSFETLRDRLDQYWQALGPKSRQETLKRYLSRIGGQDCPAYLRLASLASRGQIKAIVNMNFDTLLEEALDAEHVPYRVSTSFTDESIDHLMVYKPHGSIGPMDASIRNDLILDIANSDLFSNPDEQRCAQNLLTSHDVVSMGYSGVDAKIVSALRAFPPGSEKRDKKVFAISISRPDPRLLLAMTERASQELLVAGEDGAFENFMEFLEKVVHERVYFEADPLPTVSERQSFMTRSEREALAECLRIALSIRAGINVADRSSVTIEQHGREIYGLCLQLANASGDCLTPPEKFLLHAAAFLHDLGYFAAYSGGNVLEYPGWRLLNRHGYKTRELIENKLEIDKAARIIPATYSDPEKLIRDLLDICQFHATYEEEAVKVAEDHKVRVSGREVRVRPRLLQALFAAAEDLAMEHPFLPSPDPVVAGQVSRWIVEDPVLDLFLRRKKDEVVFSIERGRVIGRTREGHSSKKALWLLSMAFRFVDRYAAVSGGWGIRFVCEPPRRILRPDDTMRISGLLAAALEEELSESLLRVQSDLHGEVARILARARQHLGVVEGELSSRELPEPAATLALASQAVEAAQRSISREWISDLRANARMVEAVLTRQVLDHQEIFRTPFGEISRLDREVRNLLRKNIPELSRGDILIRLTTLESAIWEAIDLGDPALDEWASLTQKLGDAAVFLLVDAQQPAVRSIWGALSILANRVATLRALIAAHGQAQIAAPLARMREQVSALDGSAVESITPDLDSLVMYLRRLGDSKWKVKGVDSILGPLIQAQRKLAWLGPDVKPELLKELAVDFQRAESSLAALQQKSGKAEHEEVRERLSECRESLEKIRERIETMAVSDTVTTLKHTEALLATLQKENGRALPGAAPMDLAAARALLGKAKKNLMAPAASYISSVLDLLVIYTLGGDPGEGKREIPRLEVDEAEPRVPLDNRTVTRALAWIKRADRDPYNTLLDFYFRVRRPRREELSAMEREFKNSFDDILYPAWSFFGRNLHDGIETILMAVACFDLGSSRFRDEAVSGIRHLLGDKVVTWDEQWAYGHHECTLCTSRLLYVLSHARRLFPRDELDGFAQLTGKGIDQTVGGLLRYFLGRDPDDDAWWGLGCTEHGSRIKSADYLAWAARAVTFCLTVDGEIADRTGESWLGKGCGLAREELLTLLDQRWTRLFDIREDQLLDLRAEEPHSLILGNIAVACLDLQRYGSSIEGLRLDDFQKDLSSMADKLAQAISKIGNLSQLSRFFIWPVRLLEDSVGLRSAKERPDARAVEVCRECINSPIWIEDGPDAGSWGFNVKNTQAIITSLIEFWRYVLENEERRDRFGRLFEGGEEPPGMPLGALAESKGRTKGRRKPVD